MGRKSAAEEIDLEDLRKGLAIILRAAYALDRFERAQLEREARSRLEEGDPLRHRVPLARNATSFSVRT